MGEVKTRLIPHIGMAAAYRLHRYLIALLLQRFSEAALAPLELWYAGIDNDNFFQVCAERFSCDVFQQQGDGLGERMTHAFEATLARANSAIIVGADCISLQAEHIAQALHAVSQQDCVTIHPAEDGGYVSIAMRRLHRGIFDNVSWGSDLVLAQTQRNALTHSLPLLLLDTLWDLDRYQDLLRAGIDIDRLDLSDSKLAFSALL